MKNLLNLFAAIMLLTVVACKNDKAAGTENASTDTSTASIANPADVTAQAGDPNAAPAAPTGPTTTIEYESLIHDFGEIKEGDMVKYSFKFKNTGSEPLVISDAKGSCGCTVPDWPREPIAPGASGEIKVEFDSKGKGTEDGSKQTKRVTVTGNTNPAQTFLTISGVVRKTAAK